MKAEALPPDVFQVGHRVVEGDEDEQGCHPTSRWSWLGFPPCSAWRHKIGCIDITLLTAGMVLLSNLSLSQGNLLWSLLCFLSYVFIKH